jgi:hypothetical protein
MTNKVFVNTQVPETLASDLQTIADEKQISRSDVVRQALVEFVERMAHSSIAVTALHVNPHVSPED